MFKFHRFISYGFASNPYRVLGLQNTASPIEVKMAYYKLAQQVLFISHSSIIPTRTIHPKPDEFSPRSTKPMQH